MTNSQALIDLVDEYARQDAAEKAAKVRKEQIKKQLMAEGLTEFDGTHASLTITESDRITLDPETVRGVVTPKQFLSIISVSTDKARKIMDKTVFDACVDSIAKVQTVRIKAKVPA
jgi:hypothetical protein